MMKAKMTIQDGVLVSYRGMQRHVTVPDGVRMIGKQAFHGSLLLASVHLPDSVEEIGEEAFSVGIALKEVHLGSGVRKIGPKAFYNSTSLRFVNIPDSVREIGAQAFEGCWSLTGIDLPDSVTRIGESAFNHCMTLSSVRLPAGLETIEDETFMFCNLHSVEIPEGVIRIGNRAFCSCLNLSLVILPDSVQELSDDAFENCKNATFVCGEGSCAHRFLEEHLEPYVFDYQYKVFHGVLPPRVERRSSPFLADEEPPFVFISYSHLDRDTVLGILSGLYESGWRIWYDEGLTIGDHYDETLENHIRNCTAVLLFVTQNSAQSRYIIDNEIPWAIRYGKPVIRCVLDGNTSFEITEDAVAATVSPKEIESAFERVAGLEKGETRTAKGISVAVNPADRESAESSGGNAYAACLYSGQGESVARVILLEARKSGCSLYDAVENGMNEEKLDRCASLVVFLDRAFLEDSRLSGILSEAWKAGRDIAVCQLEEIEDLPPELAGLDKMQWLNFAYGMNEDLITKLARHLQARGCRNTAVVPGFEYEINEQGIVIKRYTGNDPEAEIEGEYGGIPVVGIAESAFEGIIRITSVRLPDSVREIGCRAFKDCVNLDDITLGNGIEKIGESAFEGCKNLSDFFLPEGVTVIENRTFRDCNKMKFYALPDRITAVGDGAFALCDSLDSLYFLEQAEKIGKNAFGGCDSLTSLVIPKRVKVIEKESFSFCGLKSVVIPSGVEKIESKAFWGSFPAMVFIPDSVTEIEKDAFGYCGKVTVYCPPGSCAWQHCQSRNIRVRSKPGFFRCLFYRKYPPFRK